MCGVVWGPEVDVVVGLKVSIVRNHTEKEKEQRARGKISVGV